jgi:hypothetical protein
MKSNFIGKVKGALSSLGNAPYDDEHTRVVLSEASKKTVEYLEANDNAKKTAELIEHTSDFIAVTEAMDEAEISLEEFNKKNKTTFGK